MNTLRGALWGWGAVGSVNSHMFGLSWVQLKVPNGLRKDLLVLRYRLWNRLPVPLALVNVTSWYRYLQKCPLLLLAVIVHTALCLPPFLYLSWTESGHGLLSSFF